MKQFTTIKIGYTSGIYGCSNEYFNTIIVNEKGISNFCHYGMHGSEDRVNTALKEAGYEEKYCPSDYGKMTTSGSSKIMKNLFMDEYRAIEYIKNI